MYSFPKIFAYFLGFQVPGNRNQGRIYIKYSLEQFDIHFDQEISLTQGGYEYQRFGHSIATLGENCSIIFEFYCSDFSRFSVVHYLIFMHTLC